MAAFLEIFFFLAVCVGLVRWVTIESLAHKQRRTIEKQADLIQELQIALTTDTRGPIVTAPPRSV